MRHSTKIKVAVARVPLRKSVAVAPLTAAPLRRAFPAWIDSDERTTTFAAKVVSPRVRDGLVLRVVGQKKSAHARNPSHGPGAR